MDRFSKRTSIRVRGCYPSTALTNRFHREQIFDLVFYTVAMFRYQSALHPFSRDMSTKRLRG